MQFNVSQQLKEPIGSTRSYPVDQMVSIPDLGTQAVRGRVKMLRTDRGLLVQAELNLTMETACSRCLSPCSLPIQLRIEEVFSPSVDIHSGAPLPPPEEPGAFTIDENHTLDLTEATRQYALLALPMKPLCRSECAGLCPQCGHNLNLGPCGCSPRPRDPRWALLEKLA
ncbi:MAG TPA: DUF177 domain-containing protein [Dehalococcoidia bacterium]|nr:DUF177 domain-containing protein [Dehalococcoidia bacterium]